MDEQQTHGTRDMIQRRSKQIALIQDARGLGTGLVVGPDGWILTNKHVAPSVGPFRIILADGRDVQGVGIHQCTHSDLAIVKMGATDLDAFDIEASVAEDFHVGDDVYALGHPRGCRFSVARGILSNPHREIEKEFFAQADININPGNSGGPLVDKQGLLVGIVSGTLSNSQGLGLAVPGYVASDYVRQVRRLVRYGIVKIPAANLMNADADRPAAEVIVRDAVGSLVQAGKAAIKVDAPDEGHFQLEHRNSRIDVRCRDGLFTVAGSIIAMGPAERNNPKLLARILELNGTRELGGASFFLYEDSVYVGQMRPTAGLDAVEALWAMDLVLYLVQTWSQKLATMVFEGGTNWNPGYAQPAPNPYPAPHPTPHPAPNPGPPPGPYGQASPYPQAPAPGAPMGPYGQPPPGAPFGPVAGPAYGSPVAPPGPYGFPQPHPFGGPQAQPNPNTNMGAAPRPPGAPPTTAPADPGYPILTLPTPDPRWR